MTVLVADADRQPLGLDKSFQASKAAACMGASHLHLFPPRSSEIHTSRLMPLECLFSESWKLQGIQENSTECDGKHMASV